MFKNSTHVFVEDSIWGNKDRKYIANYGTFVLRLQKLMLRRRRGILRLHLWVITADHRIGGRGDWMERVSMRCNDAQLMAVYPGKQQPAMSHLK